LTGNKYNETTLENPVKKATGTSEKSCVYNFLSIHSSEHGRILSKHEAPNNGDGP